MPTSRSYLAIYIAIYIAMWRPQRIPGSQRPWRPRPQWWQGDWAPQGPTAPPTLLLRSVLHILPDLLQVWDLLWAFLLLLLQGSTPPPRGLDRLFCRSSILFWATLCCCALRRWLVQVARLLLDPSWLLLVTRSGGQEPLVQFRSRIPECGGPRHLHLPIRAKQWSFATSGGCLPPCLRCVSSLLHVRLCALLRPPRLRSHLPPALLFSLSSFWSTIALGSGRMWTGKVDQRCTMSTFPR